MTWSTLALVAPVLAGCSLIYNPNNLPDPRVIDAAVLDSNPCALVVDSVTPAVINEGQGDGGSAPALLVVHGNNIVNENLKVELKPPAGATVMLEPVAEVTASHDTTYLAFTVISRADIKLETDVPLDVVVTQGSSASCTSAATLPGQLTLHGRKELTDLTKLDPQYTYSMVKLPSVMPAGPAGLVIRSVSSIATGTITAKATGTVAGPGGSNGGGGAGNGPGGGGVGGSVSGLGLGGGGGGGGAGYATDGKPGGKGSGGGNAGTAGIAGLGCGDDEQIGPNNRASSGGAGGAGGLTAIVAGGPGGGGGGTVALSAGGDISVDGVLAQGGDGAPPNSGGGGGGGGGAGGTVLLQTKNGTLTAPLIRVAGGAAGSPNGGAGSVGRVRWDAPGDTAPGAVDATPVRGPSFVVPNRMFTTASPQINLKGPGSRGFIVRVIDQENVPHDSGVESFNDAGAVTISPRLSGGHNRICMILDGGPQTTIADQCIDVAYLP